EMRPRVVEVAAADLERCAGDVSRMRPARRNSPERGGTHPVRLIPLADRQQRLDLVDGERRVLHAVVPGEIESLRRYAERLAWPSDQRQHVGEERVCPLQIVRGTVGLEEPHGPPELHDALLTASEVSEIDSEHRDREVFGPGCADRTRERYSLLADH